MKITNTFVGGKMNMDIDQRLLPKGQYFKAMNIEVINPESNGTGGDDYGDSGVLRNSLGNLKPVNGANVPLNVTNISGVALVNPRCIGACINPQSNSIYWLITSTYEDLIVEYLDTPNVIPTAGTAGTAGAISYIARAVKGVGAVAGKYFNFNVNYPVTGINYFNGFLLWTDNLNPPRMIDVSTFKAWTLPNPNFIWNQDDINVIVKPPLSAPKIELINDNTDKNYIKDKFLYFSYRFKYTNNRFSSFAPFSMVAFTPSAFSFNSSTSGNSGMLNFFNKVNITVATGARQVTDIQLLFKDSQFPNIYVIETINKKKPIIGVTPVPNNSTWVFKGFDNSKIYRTLPSYELTRLFDNVPIAALSQDFIGSRLIYGNYKQFYNLINSFNSKIIANYLVYPTVSSTPIPTGQVRASFKTNRDYEFGFSYVDEYGRMSTPITSPTNTSHISSALVGKRISFKITVFHSAPFWAKKYRIFIKQNNKKYYNLFPIAPYVPTNEVVTYFLLSSVDKNKVSEGDYVTVKSDYNGITYSSTQYKALEVGFKDAGAINSSTSPVSPAGIYLKIALFTSSLTAPTTSYSYVVASLRTQYVPPTTTYMGWLNQNTFNSPAYYSPIIYYPFGGVSEILPNYNANLTISAYPPLDVRYIIEYAGIVGTNHCFNYRQFGTSTYINGATPVPFRTTSNIPVLANILLPNTTTIVGKLTFSAAVLCNIGDTWRLNVYSHPNTGKTVFGTKIQRLGCIMQTNFSSQSIPAGSQLSFGKLKNSAYVPPLSSATPFLVYTNGQKFISPNTYTDIQEWFWESGAYLNFNQLNTVGTNESWHNVIFRYASQINTISTLYTNNINIIPGNQLQGGIVMIITTVTPVPNATIEGYMEMDGFEIAFNPKPICIEVTPKQQDVPIFHECPEDLDIITINNVNFHGGNQQNQTTTLPAIVTLDPGTNPIIQNNSSFNCWAYSNGVESSQILDDFNSPSMEWSPRVMVPVDDYEEQTVSEGLTYSGVYKQDSNVNNLNQFNISLGNFKYLDKSFGSVQKIKSRNTDLVVFQQDKVSKVLFGKNLLSDSTGGGQVASIPEVLGTQIAYQGEFGISNNPESFAQWDDNMFFTDSQRGAVLRLGNDGLFDISSNGMRSFFNSSFKSQPDTLKIGVFDPYYKRYILSETDFTKSQSLPSATVVNDPLDTLSSVDPNSIPIILPA